MSGEINFDEFQREISEAERYLSSDPGTVVGEIRSSMTFEPMRRSTGSDDIRKFKFSTPHQAPTLRTSMDSGASLGKYASPEEREKLIKRLLEERSMRKSGGRAGDHQPLSSQKSTRGHEEESSSWDQPGDYHRIMHGEDDLSNSVNIIGYSKERGSPMSMDSLSDDGNDHDEVTMSNTLMNTGNMETLKARHDDGAISFSVPLAASTSPRYRDENTSIDEYQFNDMTSSEEIPSKERSPLPSKTVDKSLAWHIPVNGKADAKPPIFKGGRILHSRTSRENRSTVGNTSRNRSVSGERGNFKRDKKSRSLSPNHNGVDSKIDVNEKKIVSAAVRDPYSRSYRVSNEDARSGRDSRNNVSVPSSSGSAKKYLKSKDDLEREANEIFKETYTFQPKLATGTTKLYSTKHRVNISSRIEQLHANHDKTMRDREKMKRDLERSEIGECTFTPKISEGTEDILRFKYEMERTEAEAEAARLRAIANQKNKKNTKSALFTVTPTAIESLDKVIGSSLDNVSDRLHKEASRRATQQHWRERGMEQARKNKYTFQPQINPYTSAIVGSDHPDYKPIYKRVVDIQREKQENLHRIHDQIRQSEQDINTFQPNIDDRSRELAEKRITSKASYIRGISDVDVETRLLREGREVNKRKQKLFEAAEDELEKSMMQTKPSKGSQAIVQANGLLSSASFEERLKSYSENSKQHFRDIKAVEDKKQAAWFKPKRNEKSDKILTEVCPAFMKETEEERSTRLYRADVIAREARKKKIDDMIYGNLTFTPSIDKISKQLGRESDVKELYENTRGSKVREAAIKRAEEKMNEFCSFRPNVIEYKPPAHSIDRQSRIGAMDTTTIWEDGVPVEAWGSNSRHSTSSGSYLDKTTINMKQPEKMAKEIRQKEREKEESRRNEIACREIEELSECTFQPTIPHYTTPISDEPIVVRGISRHLELKHMKEMINQEKKQREAEVFRVQHVEKYRNPETGQTQVEPFHLSQYSSRKSRAIEELEARDRSELTFAPVVNVRENQKYIERLLETEDLSYDHEL